MAGFFIVSCLILVVFLDCMFVDLERTLQSNAADCTKLLQADCDRVGACVWDSDTGGCTPDPCYERVTTGIDTCNVIVGGPVCQRINTDQISFCVTSTRVELFTLTSARCSLEWGDTKIIEEGFCHTLSGCDTVSPIEVMGGLYYVCNEKPPVTDPCNNLNEEICPYIGKCMWEGGQCVADPCWEKTYTGADNCKSGCEKKIISNTGTPALGYCKTASHDLHDKCNGGTGTNFVTKQVACSGYPDECKFLVTINNYEGGTLYVCSTAEGEFTIEKSDAAFSLNSFAIAVSVLILLVLMF